jgi:hypothetical protein
MINEYLRDSGRIGFTFHCFRDDKWINDLRAFDSSYALHSYFRKSKRDLFLQNFETFVTSFAFEDVEKTQVRKEAEKDLLKALRWVGKTHDYDKIIKGIIRGEGLADNLVESVTGERKMKALMQKSILYNFLREEVRHLND